ncbi:MAG TPA: hypothetical protein VFM48_01825 [Aquabacterium sp.]|nr:hypothetical protein [Aquabacterium sp.]
MLNLGYAIAVLGAAAMTTSYVYASDVEGIAPWALVLFLSGLNWAFHRCALDQHETIQRLQDENDRLTALYNGET